MVSVGAAELGPDVAEVLDPQPAITANPNTAAIDASDRFISDLLRVAE
jgi:hypothetical protein